MSVQFGSRSAVQDSAYATGKIEDDDSWEPQDRKSTQGYEEIDQRMVLQAVYNNAPNAQQEAMRLYWDAEVSGDTVADLARAQGKDPNVVRNNFQALKRRVKRRDSPE